MHLTPLGVTVYDPFFVLGIPSLEFYFSASRHYIAEQCCLSFNFCIIKNVLFEIFRII